MGKNPKEKMDWYRAAFDSVNDSIFIVKDNKFLICNDKTLEMFQCSREEIVNSHPWEFSPEIQPDGQKSTHKAKKVIDAALMGSPQRFYWRHCRKDGTQFDAEVSLSRVEIEGEEDILAIVRDISDQKRAELAVEESERNYHELFNSANDALEVIDPETGIILEVNQAVCDLTGYNKEEIVSTKMVSRSGGDMPDAQKLALEKMNQAMSEGPQTFEWLCYRKDGSSYWAEISLKKVEIGGKIRIMSVVRDVTDRREAIQSLREKEETLRALLNAPTESALLVDPDGKILATNDIAAKRLGKKPDELIGLEIFKYLPKSLSKSRSLKAKEVFKSGKPVRFQDKREDRLYDNNIYPVFDSNKKITSLAIFARDITDIEKNKDALIESESKFKNLTQTAPVVILIISPDFKILEFNEEASRLYGIERDKALNKNYLELCLPDHAREPVANDIKLVLGGKSTRNFENEVIAHDGETRILNWNAERVIDAQGNPIGALSIGLDITENKRAENALRESERKYRSLINNIPDVVWTTDSKGQTSYISNNVQEVYGYSASEIYRNSGELWFNRIHPEDIDFVKEKFGKLVERGEEFNIEYRIQRKDGKWIWLHDRAISRYDKNGIIRVDGIFSDTTAIKESQEEIKKANEELTLKHQELLEKNIALKSVLDHIEEDKKRFQHDICSNIEDISKPIIEKLRRRQVNLTAKEIDIFEDNLQSFIEIGVDRFKADFSKLSPREIELCEGIRNGLTSKELADKHNIAVETVHKHRESIRKKLNLKNRNINLSIYLKARPLN